MKNNYNPVRVWRFLFWFFTISIALIHPWWAWQGYPLGEVDPLWFLPAPVSYRLDHGFINSLHPPSFIFDSTGHRLFTFYPTGFPWFMSRILVESTGRGAFTSLALLNSVSFLITAFFMDRYLIRKSETAGAADYLAGGLGMLCLATYTSSYCIGRSDFLAALVILIMCWIAAFSDMGRTAQRILIGFFLGCLAFVHPVAALMTACFLGIYLSRLHPAREVFETLSIQTGLGVGVLLGWLLINPVPFGILVGGIEHHSDATLVHGSVYKPLKYLIFHSYATGFGILFLGGALFLWGRFRKEKEQVAFPVGVILFTLVLCFLLYWFVGRAWDKAYNLWTFTPLCILVFVQALVLEQGLKQWQRTGLILLLLIGSTGFLHRSAMFYFYQTEGMRYADFRREISVWMEKHPGNIAVSKSLWVASEDFQRMKSFGTHFSDSEPGGKERPRYIFFQQRYTELDLPPLIPGYALIENYFCNRKPQVLGMILSKTMPGYFYAIYQRSDLLGSN